MEKIKKHCDTCAYSYIRRASAPCFLSGRVQCCSSPEYNAADYTHEMFMEDRAHGYCRFWAPREQKGRS